MEQSNREPRHMGKSEAEKFAESWRGHLEKAAEDPHDETAGDATEHLENDRDHEVHEVLPSIAVGPAGERDKLDSPLFVFTEGDIAKLFKLVNGGEVTRDVSTQLSVLGNLGKSAFYPVEGLKGVKNSLLLSVESYKTLLICHAILLVLTVVALVAMARA